jgi:lipoate-protein ligase A
VSLFRLLVDGPVDGVENMARDRAIQLAVEEGASPPTLRLYGWVRPTLTLGRFQATDSVDLAACKRLGVDVVRRFTGGRGVLHDHELTYAVVAGVPDGVPRGVAASYAHLCEPLAEAFRRLGVHDASVTERDSKSSKSPACYLATTRADLSFGALKLSGSAQVWHGDTVLQHGSFVIARDVRREAEVFRLTAEEERALAEGAATLESATGRRPEVAEIARAVTTAFEDVLGIDVEPGRLTQAEVTLSLSLKQQVRVASEG